jgi:hypothetical protein
MTFGRILGFLAGTILYGIGTVIGNHLIVKAELKIKEIINENNALKAYQEKHLSVSKTIS